MSRVSLLLTLPCTHGISTLIFLGNRSFFMLLWLRQTPADTLFCLKLESSHRSTIVNTKISEIQVLEATISQVAPPGTIGDIFIDLYCTMQHNVFLVTTVFYGKGRIQNLLFLEEPFSQMFLLCAEYQQFIEKLLSNCFHFVICQPWNTFIFKIK